MIKVYDVNGQERSLEWALSKYNPDLTIVAKSRDRWEVIALHEVIGPSSMTVRLRGSPTANIPVAFWYPGAREDPNTIPCHSSEPKQPRKIQQKTDVNGHTGFGMGGGAYYRPDQGEHGPHAVWVSQYPEILSDLVDGLGMIGGTTHAHLEPVFQFTKGVTEPSPSNCEDLESALERIIELAEDALAGIL